MSGEVRHVRVTVVGTATAVLDSHQRPTRAIRVRYAGADRECSTLLLQDSPNVTVEDVTPPRSWTPGDVVAGEATVYMRDQDGMWRGACSSGFPVTATDGDMTDATDVDKHGADDAMTVLRYQAGGDA